MRIYGTTYLRRTFGPTLATVMETPNLSYEINATLIGEGENMGENRHSLRRLAEHLFNAVINSLTRIPTALTLIAHCIFSATQEQYPDATLVAVGGAIFLRFLAPAIVSPNAFGVTTEELPYKVCMRERERERLMFMYHISLPI